MKEREEREGAIVRTDDNMMHCGELHKTGMPHICRGKDRGPETGCCVCFGEEDTAACVAKIPEGEGCVTFGIYDNREGSQRRETMTLPLRETENLAWTLHLLLTEIGNMGVEPENPIMKEFLQEDFLPLICPDPEELKKDIESSTVFK